MYVYIYIHIYVYLYICIYIQRGSRAARSWSNRPMTRSASPGDGGSLPFCKVSKLERAWSPSRVHPRLLLGDLGLTRATRWPLQDIRLLRGYCARINHHVIPPAHLHCPPWCNTIARLLDSVRLPFRPPVCMHAIHHTILVIRISWKGQATRASALTSSG